MPITQDTKVVERGGYSSLETESGIVVTVRKMTGRDMIKFEKMLMKKGSSKMESTFRLLELLSCEPHAITYVELERMESKDLLELTRQLNDSTGMGNPAPEVEDDDEDY